ncbi:MAG: methionyl-tRNA formyltransferase [Armatimonadota bacterium]|nr:methionyl-tRNA formyltransferase [Armatimonadota bacterium]
MLKIVFAGTSEFAVPSLCALVASEHDVLTVITQPDRPSGRGGKLQMTPVKEAALAHGLLVLQPEKISEPEFVTSLKELGSVDAMVVVAYGQKIPSDILRWPKFGVINVHGSLLPKYRGAAPIQHALIAGEKTTGVTTMLIDEGWDTGPILLQREVEILPDENAGELSQRLAEVGAQLLLETLAGLEQGTINPVSQDHSLATYAPSLKSNAGLIDWSASAEAIINLVRGCTPKPGAFTSRNGLLLKVWRARAEEVDASLGSPGEIMAVDKDGIVVAAGQGMVRLLEVQPASRRKMSAAEYALGARLKPGDRFDLTVEAAQTNEQG